MRAIVYPTILAAAAVFCISASVSAQRKDTVDLIKEGVGVGGIKVGSSTSKDVEKKYGRAYLWEKNKKYSYQMTYPDKGLSFYICQADARETIFLIEIKSPFKGKTTKGITIGRSTKQETEKAYGKPRDGFEYPGINFYFNRYGRREIITEIDILERSGIKQCDR